MRFRQVPELPHYRPVSSKYNQSYMSPNKYRSSSQKITRSNSDLQAFLYETPLRYDDPGCNYAKPTCGVMISLDSKFAKKSIQNARNQFMPKPQKAPFDFESFQTKYIQRLNTFIEAKYDDFRPPQMQNQTGYSLITTQRRVSKQTSRKNSANSSSMIGSRSQARTNNGSSRKQEWRITQQQSKQENTEEIGTIQKQNQNEIYFEQDNNSFDTAKQSNSQVESLKSKTITEQINTQQATNEPEEPSLLAYNTIQVSMNIQK